MRAYELVFIVHPDLDENAFKEVLEKVKSWITDGGGQVEKVDLWGKRRLAYPIRKQNDGQYVMMNINIAPKFSGELEHSLRFLEPILRFQIIVK